MAFANLGIALGAAADEHHRMEADRRAQEMMQIQQQDAMHRAAEEQRRAAMHPRQVESVDMALQEQRMLRDMREQQRQLSAAYSPVVQSIYKGDFSGVPDFLASRGQANGLTQQIVPGANGAPGTVRWLKQDGSVAYEHPHTQEAYAQSLMRAYDLENAALQGASPFGSMLAEKNRQRDEAYKDAQIRELEAKAGYYNAGSNFRDTRADAIAEGRGMNGAGGIRQKANFTQPEVEHIQMLLELREQAAIDGNSPLIAKINGDINSALLAATGRGVDTREAQKLLNLRSGSASSQSGGRVSNNQPSFKDVKDSRDYISAWLADDGATALSEKVLGVVRGNYELREAAAQALLQDRTMNPAKFFADAERRMTKTAALVSERADAISKFVEAGAKLPTGSDEFVAQIGADLLSDKPVDLSKVKQQLMDSHEAALAGAAEQYKPVIKKGRENYEAVIKTLDAVQRTTDALSSAVSNEVKSNSLAQQQYEAYTQRRAEQDKLDQEARSPSPEKAAAHLTQLEDRYELPNGVLDAIWLTESSRGKNMRTSKSSAKGHFQFTDSTAKLYGLQNPDDFFESADAAARYLSDLRDQFGGDIRKAVTAYYAGPGNVGNNPQNTTHAAGGVDYANRVFRLVDQRSNQYG